MPAGFPFIGLGVRPADFLSPVLVREKDMIHPTHDALPVTQ